MINFFETDSETETIYGQNSRPRLRLRPEIAKIRDRDWDWDLEIFFFETETETLVFKKSRPRPFETSLARPDQDWDSGQPLIYGYHIPIFRQEFQLGELIVLQFDFFALEFSEEAINIRHFAWECHEI